MNEHEYTELFRSMDHEHLVETALRLLADTERLRRELDEVRNVIR